MRCISFAIFFLISFVATAQIRPAENDTLNYRLVGFSVPAQPKTGSYLLEIAEGRFNNDYDFQKNIIYSKAYPANRIVETVPAFGKEYTWRISYLNKRQRPNNKTPLRHFVTGYLAFTDTARFRYRIIDTATAHKDLIIFHDASRAAYDMSGMPVWFLPAIGDVIDSLTSIRDMEITPQGTITFLAGSKAVEVNYDGELLWMAPNDGRVSNDTSEYYHHEFTRLANGNYMVAGHESGLREIPKGFDTTQLTQDRLVSKDGKRYIFSRQGTLIEYDPAKNVVWSWRSSQYFSNADIFGDNLQSIANTHMNAFYFDELQRAVYVSFRDLSRVIKIKYPEGVVIAEYGQSIHGEPRQGNGMFYGQHCCRVNANGQLYLFNNNIPFTKDKRRRDVKGIISTVAIYDEPKNESGSLTKAWEQTCNIDTFAAYSSVGGGSVYELGDGAILVSMGSVNRDYIVGQDKKIVWNAVFEMKNGENWMPYANYRSSPADHRKFLQLIFK
ncbi:aryl-sulfate sulfotransferase [Polluticoccus soli]|uniref:aryl-sulfate sulfotransferase n=1 Tax=Polluticoccus soli TaxID=3034150 RepID=UPI0023E2DD4D|nr:aryl-sulfate sulfotransferase [Flavipsychrobacter sp. JY13-12]